MIQRPALLITVLLLLAGLGPGRPAAAQTDDQLGVVEAIDLAQRQNPRLGQVRQQIRFKAGEWWTAWGLQAPQLIYFREGIDGGTGFAEQRWGLSQRVDFPLHTYYRLRRVGTEQDALSLTLDAEQTRVQGDVKKAYTDLLYTQELVHLRTEEVRLSEQLVEAATVRVEVGEASELELMKAEIQAAEAQSNLEDARRQFQDARYALFTVVGLDPDQQRYEIAFPDTLVYLDVAINQSDVLGRLGQQPALRSARRHQEAARLGIKQTRSALLPALTVDLYQQDFGSGFDQYGFQVGLKLPLWLVPNFRGEMRQARAEAQQWAWREDAVFLDLKQQAEQAWHGYETAQQTIDRFRTTVQPRSDELLRRTLEGYRLGEIDLLALLDTQRTYLAAQLRYYETLRDYYHQLIDLERFLNQDIVFNPAYVNSTQSTNTP